MLILKLSSLFWLIISMILRGTLDLMYTCSAQLMVYSLISVHTTVFCTNNCDYDTKSLDKSHEDN